MAKNKKKSVPPAQKPIAVEASAISVEQSSIRNFWLIWLGIFVVALIVRVFDIGLRPLHNDEGVNYFFIEAIRRDGFFHYSHENYHGPSYFYLTALCTFLFGDGEFGLRSSAIIAGLAVFCLPLMLRKLHGDKFVLIASALIALSSSFVFYSRYAIHETLFLFAGGLLAFSMYRWHIKRSIADVYYSFVGLALLIATKETFIISLASIGLSFLMVGADKQLFVSIYRQKQHFLFGTLLMVVIVALLFTGGLQWAGGLREMFMAVPQWMGRNRSDTGHFKPFVYYAQVIGKAEPHLYLFLALPILCFFIKPQELGRRLSSPNGALLRFSFSWGLSAWLIYSFVNYKTPWLIISVVFPVIILIAYLLDEFRNMGPTLTKVASVGLVAAVLSSSYYTYRFNFQIPYTNYNPYSYVHTSEGMVKMIDELRRYSETHTVKKILVGVEQYWPLPYYLKPWAEKNLVEYLNITDDYLKGGAKGTKDPNQTWQELREKYSVILANKDKNWTDPAWVKIYYRFSDVQESNTYFLRSTEAKK